MMGVRGKKQARGEALIMAHVQDVAAYILDRLGPMSAMKLQKLCYFCYGYHLVWEERPLFPERFEAWANGPVSPPLYQMHRGRFELAPGDIPGKAANLDRGERESIDLVLEAYGKFTAHQLSAMTHSEGPWVQARKRDLAGLLDRSSEVLRDEDIAAYFEALTSADADGQGQR
jgi:uncharacterized phage-associated protein